MAEVLESADAGSGEAGGDIAGKIEEGVLRPWRRPEESFVVCIFGREASDEFGPDFVVRLADGRPKRDRKAGAVRPAPLHGRDRRFKHPAGSAAPAGMGHADHARRFIHEQDGGAIGGGYADSEARHGGFQSLRPRPPPFPPPPPSRVKKAWRTRSSAASEAACSMLFSWPPCGLCESLAGILRDRFSFKWRN